MINTHRVNVYNEYTEYKFTVQFPYDDFEEYVEKFKCKLLSFEDDDEKVIGKLSGYRLSLYDCWMDYYFEEKENPISPRNIIDDMDSDVAGLMCLFTDDFCIKSRTCRHSL